MPLAWILVLSHGGATGLDFSGQGHGGPRGQRQLRLPVHMTLDVSKQRTRNEGRGSLERETSPTPSMFSQVLTDVLPPPIFLGMPQDSDFLKWASFSATYVLSLDSDLLLHHGIFPVLCGFSFSFRH